MPLSDTAVWLITTVPTYKGVSSDTIAFWIKKTMEDEGINSGFFPLIAADLLLLVKNRRVEIAFQQY